MAPKAVRRRPRGIAPDVILMDLRMPKMDGVSAIAALTAAGVPARVLVLTTYDTDGDVLAAIEAGATGYLLKDAPPNDLFKAVRAAPPAARRSFRRRWPPASSARCGHRCRSRSASASSRCWSWSPRAPATGTPPRACSSARRPSRPISCTSTEKLGVNDRAAAVAEAFNRGLLDPAPRTLIFYRIAHGRGSGALG